jgi:hypothetical protein
MIGKVIFITFISFLDVRTIICSAPILRTCHSKVVVRPNELRYPLRYLFGSGETKFLYFACMFSLIKEVLYLDHNEFRYDSH